MWEFAWLVRNGLNQDSSANNYSPVMCTLSTFFYFFLAANGSQLKNPDISGALYHVEGARDVRVL